MKPNVENAIRDLVQLGDSVGVAGITLVRRFMDGNISRIVGLVVQAILNDRNTTAPQVWEAMLMETDDWND